ncbi:hypothetical protein MKW98_017202 [Papaver atlanticum]|uniref:Fungal lipase-type domain-containing protein n=1 Tax=Papaver atlanticum TaxID=357466 RepID=A0AAD4SAW9_9MAGN|nr:hypothetical protein MKW98_017202 [Papaver atlanticum]
MGGSTRNRFICEITDDQLHEFGVDFGLRASQSKQKKIEKIGSKRDFKIAGPLHLTNVDWQSGHHRRCIAASLVHGVYTLEYDRQENRQGSEALAPPWWEFFNFQLLHILVDSIDSSTFGAIYESKHKTNNYYSARIPRYVIAFRGTTIKKHSVSQDVKLDLQLIKHGLHQSQRFGIAMQAVQNMVSVAGACNVWLAGHSLGSSIAMLAGKNMAKTGNLLEAYLFNTPFISAPIQRIKDEKVRHGVRIASSLVKAGLTIAIKGKQDSQKSDDPFSVLSAWTPNLFVNPADHVCSEYIGYFEHREKMESLGVGRIERYATQTSVTGLLKSAIGRESEVIHLIPSAHVTINRTPSLTFKKAHGIHQWLRDDLHFQSKVYRYTL